MYILKARKLYTRTDSKDILNSASNYKKHRLNKIFKFHIEMAENQRLEDTGESWDKQSQKVESSQVAALKPKKTNMLYDMDWFPMTTSPWIASIAFFHFAIFYLHVTDFYFTTYEKLYSNSGLFSFSTLLSPDLAPLGYVINILLNILSLVSFFYNDINEEGLKYLVAWLGNKIFPVLRYVIELNLGLTACFFLIDDASGGFFLVTACVNLFITFFSQNYILRKDYLCCKNVTFLILYKIILILSYLLNCLGIRFVQDSGSFSLFIGAHLFLACVLDIFYFVSGFNMYRHSISRILLIGSICVYLSLSITMLYDQQMRSNNGSNDSEFILFGVIFFTVIAFFHYVMLQDMRRKGIDKNQSNFKLKVFSIFNVMQGSSENVDDDCLIRGIIRHHIKNVCTNANCFVNRNKPIYDSKKNKECFSDRINQGKTSLTKFYLKCLYEKKLEEENWNNTDLVLEYIEFFYMKLKNIFRVSQLIAELQSKYLSPFQRLKLERIKKTMLQENVKLNNELYLSQLDIENIITSELKFEQIKLQITEFLRRNLVFWKYVQKDSIDLSEMSSIVQPNFQLVERINSNWKQLAKYFEIQKRWKFLFVCYTLYVKNEKIKPQFLEYFGTNVHEEDLFEQESSHIDKTTEHEKLFNPKMIYEPNTCYIHISSLEEKSIVKQVSKYFPKMFKYEPSEIIQSPLEVLMPDSLKKIHQKRFIEWAGEGKSNNEATYEVKKIFPLTKPGFIIPVYKFYKQVTSVNSAGDYDLQYIAMMKKNKQDELVAILNDNFEIEAFTQTLSKKFKLRDEDYEVMKRLNILSFCPSLLKYTKFENQIIKGDDDFIRDQSKKNSVSHQVSNPNIEKEKKFSRILDTKKELTQTNCKIVLPNDLPMAEQFYRKGLQSIDNEGSDRSFYHGIREVFYSLKKNRQYSKFKSEIQLKRREYFDNVYYEVYFRDMEQISMGLNSGKNEEGSKVEQEQQVEHSRQEEVEQQDFHLFFESSSNSQSISIAYTNNIFIKEDNNKPVEMISHVSSITITVRVFFVIFMALVFTTLFLENYNSDAILERGIKLKLITDFELRMFVTQNSLYGSINSVENQAWVKKEVENMSLALIQMKQSYYLRKIILDQQVNKNSLYGPFSFISEFETPEYDQIDLVDLLIEKIITLRTTDLDTLTRSHGEFHTFENYILPSFSTLVNRTKTELNAGFESHFEQTEIMTVILYVLQTILLFVGFFVVLTSLIKISNSFIALMEIFTQLSDTDVKKVWRYCEFSMKLFVHLKEKDQQMSEKETGMKEVHSLQNNTSLRADENLEQEVENANLNKKVKKVEIGEQLTHIKVKSIIFIIVFLVLYGVSSFAFNIFITEWVSSLSEFKDKGYYQLFQHVPNMQIAIMGMQQKFNSPFTYNHSKYEQTVSNLNMMKDITTVMEDQTQFESMYKTVFFGDFCLMNGQQLFETDQIYSQCRQIAENTLQHGVQSFLYYLYSDISNLMVPPLVPISQSVLQQDHTAVKIIDYYLLELMRVWQAEFTDMVNSYQGYIFLVSICLIVFHVLIYIILVELFIVGNLKEKYEIYKKVYINYMPDFVVSKEKIIKAKLHVEGFLEK